MGLYEAESLVQTSTGRIMRQAFNRPKVTLGLTVATFIMGLSGPNAPSDHIWPMGSTGHSQAESHTGLKWAHVYIRPLTGRKSLGCSWAQIFGEQLTGQIWLRAANGPKYWANN